LRIADFPVPADRIGAFPQQRIFHGLDGVDRETIVEVQIHHQRRADERECGIPGLIDA
jgi:hypothetical protein